MSNKATTSEENVALMRKFVTEVQQGGNMSLIDELVHQDFHNHDIVGNSMPQGREGARIVMKSIHAGLSKIEVDVIQSIGSGNLVATNKVLYGTHTGDFMGKPATGERIRMKIMDFVTFEDGMMKEHWANLGPVEAAQ